MAKWQECFSEFTTEPTASSLAGCCGMGQVAECSTGTSRCILRRRHVHPQSWVPLVRLEDYKKEICRKYGV